MVSRLHFQYIILLSFVLLLLNWLLFGSMSVDLIFLLANLAIVVLSVLLIKYCQFNFIKLSEKGFIKKIFWFSLGIRIFAVLFYWVIFYFITGTEFDVEPSDAVWYDEIAQLTAASFSNNTFSLGNFLVDVRGNVDDSGYVMFLALIYRIFNNSIIIPRIIQAILSAATVILIYKVGKDVFGEKTGKLAAILAAAFQPFLLYASIHMKESVMIYFLFLFIYQCIKLINTKVNLLSIAILTVSLLALFTFRTVLGLIAFSSLIGYLMIAGKYSFTKKATLLISLGTIVFFLIINLAIFSEVADKAQRYAGIETEDKSSLGGKSKDTYVSGGQSFAKYAGGSVFLVQSIIMPYPSMVKTNIVLYDQTLQWYFAGGLLIWAFLSYYAYIGLYYSVKNQFKQSSILIFIVLIYTAALISSFYITSIRFNMIKIALLIPFVAFGIVSSNQRIKSNFVKYAVVVSIIVLIWNYVKLAGRGLI